MGKMVGCYTFSYILAKANVHVISDPRSPDTIILVPDILGAPTFRGKLSLPTAESKSQNYKLT